jgi:hypothetical protein
LFETYFEIFYTRLAVQIDEEASFKTGTVVPDIDAKMIGMIPVLLTFILALIPYLRSVIYLHCSTFCSGSFTSQGRRTYQEDRYLAVLQYLLIIISFTHFESLSCLLKRDSIQYIKRTFSRKKYLFKTMIFDKFIFTIK